MFFECSMDGSTDLQELFDKLSRVQKNHFPCTTLAPNTPPISMVSYENESI